MRRIFRSDIPNNNLMDWLYSVYMGAIIFILNIVVISSLSLKEFVNEWQILCENRISVEIPKSDMSVTNIASVKSILENACYDVKVLEFDDIKNIVNELNFDIDINKIGSSKILEAKLLKKTDVKKIINNIKNISSNISVYLHKDFLAPSIKISKAMSSNHVLILVLIFISIILYTLLYSYQNLKINSENIYILTLLAADKIYIFKQILLGIFKSFIVSFVISFCLSIIFVWTSCAMDYFNYGKWFAVFLIILFPVLVYLIVILISRCTIFYLLEKRKVFP